MKATLGSLILCLFWTSILAQDITISFQSKESGTIIDSIWVTNQRTNEKVKLFDSETLTLTKITEIRSLVFLPESGYIYPNPCYGQATLNFSTSVNQEIEIRVHNISGQVLSMKREKLSIGQHHFYIQFPDIGIYMVSVLKNGDCLSLKAVCSANKIQECYIRYIESVQSKPLKSTKIGKTLTYAEGDILYYSVYSGDNNTIITDSPTASKAYSIEFHKCIDPDKKNYRIVKIGSQWWMAENLAYLPAVYPATISSDTAKLYYVYDYSGTDVSDAKASINYHRYGVLYNWSAAMNGVPSSNTFHGGIQGVCPSCWHLPSDTEWEQLALYVNQRKGPYIKNDDDWNNIGGHLKAYSGWNDNGNGTDDFGFCGLPGGQRIINNAFENIGTYGFWWSSAENSDSTAYSRLLYYGDPNFYRTSKYKERGFSVRCIKDILIIGNSCPSVPSNPDPPDGAVDVDPKWVKLSWTCSDPDNDPLSYTVMWGKFPFIGGVTGHPYNNFIIQNLEPGKKYGWWIVAEDNHGCITPGPLWTFTTKNNSCPDIPSFTYDGQTYHTVQIGIQCWMKENLAYLPSVNSPNLYSFTVPCYYVYGYRGTDVTAAKATANFTTYGVLYNWPAALTACPSGWHLPNDEEWTTLTNYLINNGYGYEGSGIDIAKSMAATTNWDFCSTPGTPGNDPASNNSSGFSALPGGRRESDGYFDAIGSNGYWWSFIEYYTTAAWERYLYYNNADVHRYHHYKHYGLSVRCVKDWK